MGYKTCFTISVLAITAFIIFFILSLVMFFKLDIKNIIKIFIRKLKVVILILAPFMFVFKPVYADDSEDIRSEIRFKTRIFSVGDTNFYPDLKGDFFTFFVTVKNPEKTDIIEVYVDGLMCFKSLLGDNLKKEIPIMLKKGYEPREIVVVNHAKTGNIYRSIYKMEKDDEGPLVSKNGIEVSDEIGLIEINKRIMAFITGQNLVTVRLKEIYDDKSGIESLYFKYYTENAEHTIKAEYDKNKKDYYAVIGLPKNSKKEFFVIARDNLFNVSTTERDFISVVSDNTNPEIEVLKSGNFNEDINEEVVFKNKILFEVNTKDEVGIKEVEVFVNDENVIKTEEIYSNEGGLLKDYSLSFGEELLKAEKNNIRIIARNFGGYETEENLMVYSDITAPRITQSYVNNMEKEIGKISERFYSNKDVHISLKLMDYDDFGNERKEKIYETKLLLYDIYNNPLDVRELKCDKDGNIEFDLKAGFKGYGVIRASDGFKNELEYESRIFVLEGEDEFNKGSEIIINSENNDIFLSEVKLPILVKSTFSGIKEIKYKVDSPNDKSENKAGKLDISGKYEEDVMFMGEGDILVSNNSNDIKVTIELKSNCNNIMEKSIILNIDRTYPVINVSFSDGKENYYINHERTLQVEIIERNFLRENLSFSVLHNGKDIGKDLVFQTIEDKENPDRNRHVARFDLTNDGEYSVYGAIRDTAGNTASFKEKNFIIDKIAPVIEINYDREISENKFINEPLEVGIKIRDDNLDVSSIRMDGTNMWNGKYTYEDGLFTTSIKFAQSGEYQFSVSGKDMAGNQLNHVTSNKFILDLIKPDILIHNLINMKSYNNDFSFNGEILDENLDTINSLVTLVKESTGSSLNLHKEVFPGKISFGVDFVPKLSEYDGIYKLSVLGIDLSGNKAEMTYRFSINRFGSTFMLSEELSSISNSFVRTIGNVDISEVNYDVINPESTRVFLFRNGNTKLLNMERDYEIVSSNSGFLNSLTYSIKGSNFDEDGIYAISVYSKDEAGNTNVINKEDELISFVVDRTPPRIYSLNLSSKEEYNKAVNMEIKAFDNMKLDSVYAFNNDKPIDIEGSGDKYIIHLPVNNKKYNLKLCAKDSAGNISETKINSLSVGYENKPNIFGYLLKIFLLVITFTSIILILSMLIKRRKDGKRKDRRAY